MTCRFVKRYSRCDRWFFGSLPKATLPFLATLLLATLLCGCAAIAADIGHNTDGQGGAELLMQDSERLLSAEPVSSSELRISRESSEKISPIQLKVRHHQIQVQFFDHPALPNQFLVAHQLFSPQALPCLSPFAPRPPPFFPSQV